MKEFILVLSMWGSDGVEDHYIGQLAYMIDESMWASMYVNKHYHMKGHCFPAECAGETQCEGGLEAWRNLNLSSK